MKTFSLSLGSMDLRTNYRQDFIPHEQISTRNSPKVKRSKSTEDHVYTRRPMNEISQTSFDFRAYPKHRPPPPAEMETFLSQIKLNNPLAPETKFVSFLRLLRTVELIKEFSRRSQYRVDYEGIDTSRHPRAPLAAPKDRTYIPPIQKMDTMTVTQVSINDYDHNE